MIGHLVDAVRDRYLLPQTLETVDPDVRVALDPDETELGGGYAEVRIVASTTAPVSREIGGGGILRHALTIVLEVQDGDLEEATRRRDAITTDLVLRIEDDRTLGGIESADGRQRVARVEWSVDYADVTTPALAAFAVLTLAIDTDLRR